MKVLSLVTNRHARFYKTQTEMLEEQGVDFTHVFPPQQSSKRAERIEIDRSKIDYLKFYTSLLRESWDEYDVVHANYGLMTPFALAQPHRPIVLSLWGSDLTGRVGEVTKRFGKYCDEIIVMSPQMEMELGYEAHVIPHGIDLNQFKPMSQSEARSAVGWDRETKHVLFPYKLSRRVKNYPLAERVVEEVRSEVSTPIELQVVNDVEHEDVPLYMNAADALLLTSRREGFPNSVKEAMACNLPVVSTDVGPLHDRLEEVENSYVSKSESELVTALTDVLCSGRRSNGREYATDLSLEAMADGIIEVYDKALNGG
ncbi:glycosyltransferase family 4 protein [Natrarchaeobius oligotrophus]|uniref:Glycosyltransferase n=1 Tax=Natrarchaeobius chitinivorans TaxID=1679083 RepID=A0A3N6NBW5_NATCH|nr:glycosyltransferase family 4 protein [Natrarchaeobius chitinivorans]RQG96182.1 glycosyltransferase [Natrarchaeobius chitinivorans]